MIGGAAGALVGAGTAYGMSRQGTNEKRDKRIQELEESKAQGKGSFGQALELVAEKMRAGVQEAMHDHPAMGTAAGGVVGGAMGSTIGHMAGKIPEAFANLSRYVKS